MDRLTAVKALKQATREPGPLGHGPLLLGKSEQRDVDLPAQVYLQRKQRSNPSPRPSLSPYSGPRLPSLDTVELSEERKMFFMS